MMQEVLTLTADTRYATWDYDTDGTADPVWIQWTLERCISHC